MINRRIYLWGGSAAAILGVAAILWVGEVKTMPSYTIEEQGGVLEVRITGFRGPVDDILAAFRSCQEGSCSCPTDEYENLQSLDVETTERGITLRLTPKPAARFDRTNIERCLDFTLGGDASSESKTSVQGPGA